MKNLWNDKDASQCKGNALSERIYSSRLLGRDQSLVLHGGGNTSVKDTFTNIFGEKEEIIHVKASGYDLATISEKGFSPLRIKPLLKLLELNKLSDQEMLREIRQALIDFEAPYPSLETLFHAHIPFKFIDHTHADAVLTISNTQDGEATLRKLYGNRVYFLPYIKPGFILAKKIAEIDTKKYEGIILLNHGIITYGHDAKSSYQKMIELTNIAHLYLEENCQPVLHSSMPKEVSLEEIAILRKEISSLRGVATYLSLDSRPEVIALTNQPNIQTIAMTGPLTPDLVTRVKKDPLVLEHQGNKLAQLNAYSENYQSYYNRNIEKIENKNEIIPMLDPAPRYMVYPGIGHLCSGQTVAEVKVVKDIAYHTQKAIAYAQKLGGHKVMDEKSIFSFEYWRLQLRKLNTANADFYKGKVVVVTGAASGIGRAIALAFKEKGAAVLALDISPKILEIKCDEILALQVDLTKTAEIKKAFEETIKTFGGIDYLVSNAGSFPPSQNIEKQSEEDWERTIDINLTTHRTVLKEIIPYLKHGIDPAILLMCSKNVWAPGPGASGYSCAKAALTQLGRVAAFELAPYKIRVNMIHPNAVFDTGIWTDEVIKKRAASYNLTEDEYKKNNLLKVEITSKDVAELVSLVLGDGFSKITGAQIPIDGGNDRII